MQNSHYDSRIPVSRRSEQTVRRWRMEKKKRKVVKIPLNLCGKLLFSLSDTVVVPRRSQKMASTFPFAFFPFFFTFSFRFECPLKAQESGLGRQRKSLHESKPSLRSWILIQIHASFSA